MTKDERELLLHVARVLRNQTSGPPWRTMQTLIEEAEKFPGRPNVENTPQTSARPPWLHPDLVEWSLFGMNRIFFVKRRPTPDDRAVSADVINPDGTAIERESPMICATCGQYLSYAMSEWVRPRE